MLASNIGCSGDRDVKCTLDETKHMSCRKPSPAFDVFAACFLQNPCKIGKQN